jgi:flagellar biosynthesis protein FlhG
MRDQADGLRRLGAGISPLTTTRRRTIAVTGGKGGVGKSTLSLNLALAYARRGSSVLIVDGDMGMADLNLLCGVAPECSLLDVVRGAPVEHALVAAHGVHLLPALNGSHRLANLEPAGRERILDEVGRLQERFDTVIFDIPAGIGDNAMAMAGAAADVVLVVTPEPLSLADAYACLKVLAHRHHLRRAFIMPNRCAPADGDEVSSRLAALVQRFLGIELCMLPPVPQDPLVPVAAAAGTPLISQNPDSPAARAIRLAARHLDALARPAAREDRPLLVAAGGAE